MDYILQSLAVLVSFPNYLLLFAGCVFGLIIGILPGMGGVMAILLLIPLTYGMDTNSSLTLIMAAYASCVIGGCLPAILINTPGTTENASTILEGFPMAQQGRAGQAIGAAMMASALGIIIGSVLTLLLIPLARKMVLAFSYSEFFMLTFFGLTVIAMVTKGNYFRGLLSAAVGILLALVGQEPINATSRFTFGFPYLEDGIELIAVIIGIFALTEVVGMYAKKRSISSQVETFQTVGITQGFKDCFKHLFLVFRSSIIGLVIGIVPGVGGTVAGFMAYAQAAQTSKNPETFGNGNVEGIIATEAAHNAKEPGALIPTIAFGIPGSTAMTVLMGALVLHGVAPGAQMIIKNTDIVYLLIVTLLLGGIIASIIGAATGKYFVPLTKIRGEILAPIIFVLSLVGVYGVNNYPSDLVIAGIFCIVGFYMKKHEFSRIALVIGLVLGSLLETSYHQTINSRLGYTAFFTRPISLTLFVLTIVVIILPYWKNRKRRKLS